MQSGPSPNDEDLKFSYDRVFAGECTQKSIYDDVGAPIISAILDGFNTTLFVTPSRPSVCPSAHPGPLSPRPPRPPARAPSIRPSFPLPPSTPSTYPARAHATSC